MMRMPLVMAGLAVAATVACTSSQDLNCAGGTVGGAAVGGLIGNQFGGGSGRTAMTALGAGAGALAGNRVAC